MADKQKTTSPVAVQDMLSLVSSGVMVMSIVPRGQAERVMNVVKSAGVSGGTILLGRKTVESKVARLLGLENKVEAVINLVGEDMLDKVMSALKTDGEILKIRSGAAFSVDVRGIFRRVPRTEENAHLEEEDVFANKGTGGNSMAQAKYELISVIVNTGYAEEIMDVARQAGATGGTILGARGTGREEDVKFFGITIVPEKEFIMIVVQKNKAKGIMKAIQEAPCLNQPGVGIAFCMDVVRFQNLGKKAMQDKERQELTDC